MECNGAIPKQPPNAPDDQKQEDTLASHLEISISESEKRSNGTLNLRDHYTVYSIDTKLNDVKLQARFVRVATAWRRYTEFEQIRAYLEETYPYIVIPPLPEKQVMYRWQKIPNDTFDPNFIDRRRAGLETFLLRVATHPVLGWDKYFIEFLQHEHLWRESVKGNGYLHSVENKLKSLNLSTKPRHSDPRFDAILDYSNTLHRHLSGLLKARSRLAEKQYHLYKLHASYGRVFSEWSANEKEMGDALQKTGHYLDSLASSIDVGLEDEELLADQLKEYLFYAISLQNICRNYKYLQLQLEQTEDHVANKNVERNKAQQGKSGLMSKLFGAVETDEVREFKVNLLDQEIQQGAAAVNAARNKLNEFSTRALADVQRFHNQKVVDLKETLTNYSLLQLKTAKKGLQTWSQIRDCLESIP